MDSDGAFVAKRATEPVVEDDPEEDLTVAVGTRVDRMRNAGDGVGVRDVGGIDVETEGGLVGDGDGLGAAAGARAMTPSARDADLISAPLPAGGKAVELELTGAKVDLAGEVGEFAVAGEEIGAAIAHSHAEVGGSGVTVGDEGALFLHDDEEDLDVDVAGFRCAVEDFGGGEVAADKGSRAELISRAIRDIEAEGAEAEITGAVGALAVEKVLDFGDRHRAGGEEHIIRDDEVRVEGVAVGVGRAVD